MLSWKIPQRNYDKDNLRKQTFIDNKVPQTVAYRCRWNSTFMSARRHHSKSPISRFISEAYFCKAAGVLFPFDLLSLFLPSSVRHNLPPINAPLARVPHLI